jgi:hypothetical protein
MNPKWGSTTERALLTGEDFPNITDELLWAEMDVIEQIRASGTLWHQSGVTGVVTTHYSTLKDTNNGI